MKKNLLKKSKKYKFKLKVWKWPTYAKASAGKPDDSYWHFVTLPKELYTEIRDIHGKGMVPITTTIGKTTWDNSLFPHTLSQSYILAVKKMIRQNEGIFEGDIITLSFVLR